MTLDAQPAAPLTPTAQPIPAFQVGVFALVKRRDTVLLVRPHKLLLPGGPQSLPGLVLRDAAPGMGIVESALRRNLLSQVGISVSDLRLVGSHMLRRGTDDAPTMRLNMIFGTEYCSGILTAQPDELKSALWFERSQLEGNVPEWLRAALQEMQQLTEVPSGGSGAGLMGGGLSLFRRRTAEKE